MVKRKKLRLMNDIMLDLELALEQLTDPKGHDMQWGEVRALVMKWLEVHAPHAQEEYVDGTVPVDIYGHLDHAEALIKKLVAIRK
jgi:hypothetical protein